MMIKVNFIFNIIVFDVILGLGNIISNISGSTGGTRIPAYQ